MPPMINVDLTDTQRKTLQAIFDLTRRKDVEQPICEEVSIAWLCAQRHVKITRPVIQALVDKDLLQRRTPHKAARVQVTLRGRLALGVLPIYVTGADVCQLLQKKLAATLPVTFDIKEPYLKIEIALE